MNCAVTNKKQISTETKINSSLGSSVDVRVEGIVPRHQCRRVPRKQCVKMPCYDRSSEECRETIRLEVREVRRDLQPLLSWTRDLDREAVIGRQLSREPTKLLRPCKARKPLLDLQ